MTSVSVASSQPVPPDADSVASFLSGRYPRVSSLVLLQSGGWSSAYAFESDEADLVVRFGRYAEDFEKERVAATWAVQGLPIPEVLELGDAFDGSFIVSRRHYGQKLADLTADRVPAVMENLVSILAKVSTIELPGSGCGIWLAPECHAPGSNWVTSLLMDRDRGESRLVDWRAKLAAVPGAMSAFERGFDALPSLLTGVRDVRKVVHGDILLNHLIADDDSITAVFDWGNSVAGDPLYDIAWMVFCIPWFPSVNREHVLALSRTYLPSRWNEDALFAYELHTAVSAMQYMAFAGAVGELVSTMDQVNSMLAAAGSK